MYMSSELGQLTHQEPVTDLKWISNPKSKGYILVSISTDGNFLFWKENTLKYSISNLVPLGNSFGLSTMYSFIKVSRSNFLSNPNKEDFTKNHLLDLSLFYKFNDYGILYLKLSASSNYLLGENPLAYNRKSSHLFDHPYGQLNAGLILNF